MVLQRISVWTSSGFRLVVERPIRRTSKLERRLADPLRSSLVSRTLRRVNNPCDVPGVTRHSFGEDDRDVDETRLLGAFQDP